MILAHSYLLEDTRPNSELYIYSLFEHLGVGRGNFHLIFQCIPFVKVTFFSVNSLMWLHLAEVILIFSPSGSEPKFNISVCVCVLGGLTG